MVGNSMKSDVVPMIDAGGWGIYVPGSLTWALEHAEAPNGSDRYQEIRDLSALAPILRDIG
jgi:putative hydrolase of the HAD superfamily